MTHVFTIYKDSYSFSQRHLRRTKYVKSWIIFIHRITPLRIRTVGICTSVLFFYSVRSKAIVSRCLSIEIKGPINTLNKISVCMASWQLMPHVWLPRTPISTNWGGVHVTAVEKQGFGSSLTRIACFREVCWCVAAFARLNVD